LGCTEQPHPTSRVLGVNTPGHYLIAGDVENIESPCVLTAASPDLTRTAICVADIAQLAIDAPEQRPHCHLVVLGGHKSPTSQLKCRYFRKDDSARFRKPAEIANKLSEIGIHPAKAGWPLPALPVYGQEDSHFAACSHC
jgi:hypothetical protein